MRRANQRGAATIELALVYATLLIPLMFGIVFTAQMVWIWHGVGEWTRDGARYASTHCWQGGDNVLSYMRTNAPPVPDQDQFRSGGVDMNVTYYAKDPASGTLSEFTCDSECSTACIPDTVTVRVSNFQYRGIMTYLGFAPVQMPEFQAAVPMEGAGCDPESGTCTP